MQERLGHASITETMDTCGHLMPEAHDAGRGALDAMFADGSCGLNVDSGRA